MNFETRHFDNPVSHHTGWFRVFRFPGAVEVWFGTRFYFLSWKD